MSFFESFLNYEKDNQMYNREIFGFRYWEYVRFVVYTEIKIEIEHLSMLLEVPDVSLKNYLFKTSELKNYLGFSKLEHCDILFISHPRRIEQNGKFENIYTDEVESYMANKYNCLTLEEPCWNSFVSSDRGHLFPVSTENIRYTDLYELNYLFHKKIYKILNRERYRKIDIEATNIINDLNQKYNVDVMHIKPRVINAIMYGIIMRSKYEKVIKKISPKAVVINYWPTDFKTMIMDICNSLEIPTIELQHGTITYDDPIEHKCYNNKLCHSTSKYFFSFGKVHTDLNFLTTKTNNLVEIGYPFLERKINEKCDLPEPLDENIKYILIVSQTIIGDEMSEFASNLATLLKDKPEYQIIFKYHPNEVGRAYPNLNKKNIIKIAQKGEEIYKYQKYSYLQVGVYSTAIYEGLAFGLPTFILNGKSGSEESKKLLSYMKKGVHFIDNEIDLVSYMDNNLESPLKSDLDKLWKQNGLLNFEKEIKKLMKEKRK